MSSGGKWAENAYNEEDKDTNADDTLCVLPPQEAWSLEDAEDRAAFIDLPKSFPAPVVKDGPRFVYYPQVSTQTYEYTRGFAIYDNKLRMQVGWVLRQDDAVLSVNEHNNEIRDN